MERNQVCALLVMQHGETVLHWVAPSRRGCTARVVNQRYGVASITKSITSILLGRLMRHRDIDVATTVADALRPVETFFWMFTCVSDTQPPMKFIVFRSFDETRSGC